MPDPWTITGSKAVASATVSTLSMASTVSFLPIDTVQYQIVFQIASYTAGAVQPVFGSTVFGASAESEGYYDYEVTASAGHTTSKVHGLQAHTFKGKIDNLQIYRLGATSFTYNYVYQGSDVDMFAVIFHTDFKEERLLNLVLSNTNQSIPIQQETDRVYLNP